MATGWLGHSKAERLATWLQQNSELRVTGEKALIESAKSGSIIASLAVNLVLNGLDDVEVRRAAQDLWPAVIIDGGINEVGAVVTQYRLDHENQACLKCWFESPMRRPESYRPVCGGTFKRSSSWRCFDSGRSPGVRQIVRTSSRHPVILEPI